MVRADGSLKSSCKEGKSSLDCVMAPAHWGEVCPLVAEERSAAHKCGQSLEDLGFTAVKKSCVPEAGGLGNSDVWRATVSLTVLLPPHSLSRVPPVFWHIIGTHVSCL